MEVLDGHDEGTDLGTLQDDLTQGLDHPLFLAFGA
jgi:hypothetical protein